jgi:hypothetical protein
MAVSPRDVWALDPGVVTVSPLVAQRHLGASVGRVARGRKGVRWSRRGNAVDGGHRHPSRPRVVQRRGHMFHDRGGPYGRTKGAKRMVAVDLTGLPVGALVVPASTHENRTTELMLQHLTEQGVSGRLELVLVDRGVTAAAARELGRDYDLAGWRSRSRTPLPPPPAGSRLPASQPHCATCRAREPIGQPALRRHEARAGVRAECGMSGCFLCWLRPPRGTVRTRLWRPQT